MLYVAGQKLESIGRLEDARGAYRAALEAIAHSQPQQPLRQALQTTKWSQGLSMPPEVKPVSGVDDMRATLLYHLAHAFLLEGGRAAEAVETATQAVELSPQSGEFSLPNQKMGVLRSPDSHCTDIGSNQLFKLIALLGGGSQQGRLDVMLPARSCQVTQFGAHLLCRKGLADPWFGARAARYRRRS